jgi:hypothetical protein
MTIMIPVAWGVVVGLLLLAGGAMAAAAVLTVLGRWPRGFRPLATWGDMPRRRAAAVWRLPMEQQQAPGRFATCAGCGRGLTALDTIFVRCSGAVHCHRCAGR